MALTVTTGAVESALMTWKLMFVVFPPMTETADDGTLVNAGLNVPGVTVFVKLLEITVGLLNAPSEFVTKIHTTAVPT